MYNTTLWVMSNLKCLIYKLQPGPLPFIYPILLDLTVVTGMIATFGFFPPEFIQTRLHLLADFSTPIPTPFFLPLPFLLFLLFLKSQ